MLTFDRKHLLLLSRYVGYPPLGFSGPASCLVQFHIDADNHIVDGPDDILPHGNQILVQFLDDGILVAASFYQFVSFQLVGIIGRYLGFNVDVGYAGV